MMLWTFKWIFISFILIFLIHHLYNFFKNVLTVPKVKDLVNKPTKEYETIMQTINNGEQKTTLMQNELDNFFSNLKSTLTPDIQTNNNSNNSNNEPSQTQYESANLSSNNVFDNPFASY
jgi:hypothetical protein